MLDQKDSWDKWDSSEREKRIKYLSDSFDDSYFVQIDTNIKSPLDSIDLAKRIEIALCTCSTECLYALKDAFPHRFK